MKVRLQVLALGLLCGPIAVAQSTADEWGALPSSKSAAPQQPAPPPGSQPAPQPAIQPQPRGADEWGTLPASKQPAPSAQTGSAQPQSTAPSTSSTPNTATPPGPANAPLVNAPNTVHAAPSAAPATARPPASGTSATSTAHANPSSTAAAPRVNASSSSTAEPPGQPEEARVVSTQERYLPGSEAHSPSTWGLAFDDPKTTRQTQAAFGGIGLLHVVSADLGPRGVLRFGAEGEYFTNGHFPVSGAANVRTAGTFAVSYVPLEWLEAYAGYSASANTNSTSSPALIQALGDLTLGVVGAWKVTPGFHLGADLRLRTYSGVGSQDVGSSAAGFFPSLVGTYDFHEEIRTFPVRLHLNLGAALDGSGSLVKSHTLTASEEYALGVNRYHRFTVAAGLEFPLPAFSPFLEYSLAAPLGVTGGTLLDVDGIPVPVTAAMPQVFSVGLKCTAIKDLTLFAAADLGFTRTVVPGIPATPPFNFLFGASFAVDPFQRGETKVVETVRERQGTGTADVTTGRAGGVVVDAQTHKPLAGVLVSLPGSGLPPVATEPDSGRFQTYDLPPGKVRIEAAKDGFKSAAQEVEVVAGKTTLIELPLEAAAKRSTFEVTVTSKKKPVAAQVSVVGADKSQQLAIPGTDSKPTKLDVPPGKYTVNVTAEGYLAQTREVQVSNGADMSLSFDLAPEPKKKLVIVKENKLEITQQVHFAPTKAVILTDSYALLDQVVDAVIKNNVKRIRVEGHTDNRGNKKTNQKLSEDRARAVGDYLIKAGLDPSRVETAGYGDSRPIAPNLTARGRELNRRVEFIILER